MNPEFRSWLTQIMFASRTTIRRIDEHVDRFMVVAGYLSHNEQRHLDFQAIAEDSGYDDSLLRGTVSRAERLDLIEKKIDHEGYWYSLKVDPFSAPAYEEEKEPVTTEREESRMECLYRECCDDANSGVRGTILKLDALRGKVEPAVGALLMDAVVDLSRISILLTKISATGVKNDRDDYISDIRERVQEILKGVS